MTAKKPTNPTGFELETGVPMPAANRGSGESKYPFDAMEVNQSFHVPATDARPKPARALASVVSSATARYATPDPKGATRKNKSGKTVPVMVEQRKYVIRTVGADDPKGIGARVFRVK